MESTTEKTVALEPEKSLEYNPLHVIYSRSCVPDIKNLLADYENPEDPIGSLKVERFKGKETNRTLCLLPEYVYEGLVKDGYDQRKGGDDFCVDKYRLSSKYPKPDETRNLFVLVPHELSSVQCSEQLNYILSECVSFKLLSKDDYTISIPLESRQYNSHRGICFIKFKPEVLTDTIVIAKSLLHDNVWYDENGGFYDYIMCFWAKEKKPNEEKRQREENPKQSRRHQPKQKGRKTGTWKTQKK